MKLKWIVLGLAGFVALAAVTAAIVAYVFFKPSLATWTALVTFAALSLEGFFWVGAGVLGWSFLASRRAALAQLRARLLGRKSEH